MMREEKSTLTRIISVSIVVIVVLSGCVSNPPKEEPKVETKPTIAVSPEVRTDFDAAMALMKAEEYKKGIELLDKVVEKSQNNPVPYVNLGIAHAKLGNLKAAEEILKLALSRNQIIRWLTTSTDYSTARQEDSAKPASSMKNCWQNTRITLWFTKISESSVISISEITNVP